MFIFSNRITRDGAVYIAPMLEKCSLLRLNLAFNRLEDEGAGHIATALLHSNSKLRRYSSICFWQVLLNISLVFSLDIRSNNIKGDGLCSLADAVKFNSALMELFLWGNVNEERACLVSGNLFCCFWELSEFGFLQALENLLKIRRFEPDNIDVSPYRVDARTYLAESTNNLDKYAYWKQVEPRLRIQPAVNREPLSERAWFCLFLFNTKKNIDIWILPMNFLICWSNIIFKYKTNGMRKMTFRMKCELTTNIKIRSVGIDNVEKVTLIEGEFMRITSCWMMVIKTNIDILR